MHPAPPLWELVGCGKFGKVYKAEWREEGAGRPVAIKKFDEERDKESVSQERGEVCAEISVLYAHREHSHIVELFGFIESAIPFVVLEYMEDGTLHDVIYSQLVYELPHVANWLRQMCSGVAYLHAQKSIHRDLKPRNLLLSSSHLLLKLADFGLTAKQRSSSMTDGVGTATYMAPEILTRGYSCPVDVYSIAIIAWEMVARRSPYPKGMEPWAILYQVSHDGYRPVALPAQSCPAELRQWIVSCWDGEPANRPSAEQGLEFAEQLCEECGPPRAVERERSAPPPPQPAHTRRASETIGADEPATPLAHSSQSVHDLPAIGNPDSVGWEGDDGELAAYRPAVSNGSAESERLLEEHRDVYRQMLDERERIKLAMERKHELLVRMRSAQRIIELRKERGVSTLQRPARRLRGGSHDTTLINVRERSPLPPPSPLVASGMTGTRSTDDLPARIGNPLSTDWQSAQSARSGSEQPPASRDDELDKYMPVDCVAGAAESERLHAAHIDVFCEMQRMRDAIDQAVTRKHESIARLQDALRIKRLREQKELLLASITNSEEQIRSLIN